MQLCKIVCKIFFYLSPILSFDIVVSSECHDLTNIQKSGLLIKCDYCHNLLSMFAVQIIFVLYLNLVNLVTFHFVDLSLILINSV